MSGMPRLWPRAIVFDLDGTLVDSAPDIASTLNKILATDGLDPYGLAEVRGFIGHGISKLVERGYDGRERPLRGDALVDKVAGFQRLYLVNIAVETRPYPGAIEAVTAFRDLGMKTGICTNKAEPLTRALLAGLQIDALFDAVVAGSKAIAAKPARDMLDETMRLLGTDVADTVMIGDSETDIATARAAGIPFVGVTFGYTKVPMREQEPDAAIDSFAEAVGAVERLAAHAR